MQVREIKSRLEEYQTEQRLEDVGQRNANGCDEEQLLSKTNLRYRANVERQVSKSYVTNKFIEASSDKFKRNDCFDYREDLEGSNIPIATLIDFTIDDLADCLADLESLRQHYSVKAGSGLSIDSDLEDDFEDEEFDDDYDDDGLGEELEEDELEEDGDLKEYLEEDEDDELDEDDDF